jgi:hypothetical protein
MKAKDRRARFAREAWENARSLYVTTEMSYQDLSDKTQISHSALIKRGCPRNENWQRLRAEHRLTQVNTQKFDAFIAQVQSGEAQPKTRARWAKQAKNLAQIAYNFMLQMHAENTLTPHSFSVMVSAFKKLQDAEFAALGIASNISATETVEGLTWGGFLRHVRAERGLPDVQPPFAQTNHAGRGDQIPRLTRVK